MDTQEREFATEEDLGPDEAFNEVHLPVLGKWVNVRILGTPEITELTYLPDLVGYGRLARQFVDNPDDVDSSEFIVQQMKYNARVAHLAVVKAKEGLPIPCEQCGMVHPPSLWSMKQAERLQHSDLSIIVEAAVGVQALMRVRPFSTAETQKDSPEPVSSGA